MTKRAKFLDLLGVAFLLAFMVACYYLLPDDRATGGGRGSPASGLQSDADAMGRRHFSQDRGAPDVPAPRSVSPRRAR